ncbi:MAG: 2Fe-2S iron-sulfur cluster-binding protein [Gammaproteobacteria bacterium]|nr:2Fe-2S iron-sulfur cluster binding domain-containing protein [Pseudomonadales bacterium]MCP5348713.1 2Fe-2S iron-sulfur cluster binding domain-containing protein [Pseudomonadales bacterium]
MSDPSEKGKIPGPDSAVELSRRDFLRNTGATVAATTVAPAVLGAAGARAQDAPPATGTDIQLTVNGVSHRLTVQDHWTLVELLRDHLQLTGTKIGCNRSECGACTVLVDGQPMYSCSQLAVWMDGRQVTTVEGLVQDGQLSPLQQAFVDHNGAQCGFCTPGQLMTATALLNSNPSPDAAAVKSALVGNICRCSNYNAIVEAVVDAGRRNGGAA